MSTIIFAIAIFGAAVYLVVKKLRKGIFKGCSDCACSCPAKAETNHSVK